LDKVGVLIVSKCLSAAAIIDTLGRSEKYSPEFYVVEKQVNPHNFGRAKVHAVVPDLDVREVAKFAKKHAGQISFGLTDTEDFITAGGRDLVERESGVQMLCVSKKYAVEASKADQRLLFDRIAPGTNPRFKVFDPADYRGVEEAVSDLGRLSLGSSGLVIKPDAPARGAGVGVWGTDFATEEEMVSFFRNVYSKGRVVVEERIEGEESSFQAFSDGQHFIPAPLTRDYKRALDGNGGRLTGGMGSYRGPGDALPFLPPSEWDRVVRVEEDAFRRWKGRGSEPGLRGIVLYDALMHGKDGFKILERNSRGGNTEVINVLTTIDEDFVEVCHRMVEGSLRSVRFAKRASVAICAVPLEYGKGAPAPPGAGIGLADAERLAKTSGGNLRVFPMDVRAEGRDSVMGTSRSVAVAGMADSVEEARTVSLEGVLALKGPLRHRSDIASRADIAHSEAHLRALRSRPSRAG
jgi:phosphoribosylamine---glycine ligase